MGDDDVVGKLLAAVAASLGGVGLVVWGGALVASSVLGPGGFRAGIADGVEAAFRLPSHTGDPAEAWPAETAATLPGPAPYWLATVVAALVAVLVAFGVFRLWLLVRRVGTADRGRLGVHARATFARAADLRTLFVTGPVPGRFILGRFGQRLVATECRATTRQARRMPRRRAVRRRQGDTGAVALIEFLAWFDS